MRAVSERFLRTLKAESHTVIARAEFRLQGSLLADVPIIGGDTKEDKTATYRRTCTLELDPSSTPLPGRDYDNSPVWPVGNEVQVYAGFQYDDGTKEEVPQGLFRISAPKISHTGGELTLTIDSSDRSRAMSRNRFTKMYIIRAGRDFGTEIKALIQDRLPYINNDEFDFMDTGGGLGDPPILTPRLVFSPNDDPWEKALDMAASFGAELFFDGTGRPVLRPEPDPRFTPASYTYESGNEALLDEITRNLADDDAYNGVIVTGQNTENSTFVPRGEAWDTDPESPTYYDPNSPELSFYGAVPENITSDYVTSNAQATAAARARLLAVSGIMESVEFNGICNAAQEAGDIIRIKDPDSGVDATYILDSLTKGLGPEGDMSGTTRKRKIV